MKEIHEGVFSTHIPGHAMARKILQAGYFWSTMEKDCYQYARKCHKCQAYADNIHTPPTPLNVLVSPWPFAMWGMNVIGPIEPKASNGHRFILVAIDYFTKWVEAASYAHVTSVKSQIYVFLVGLNDLIHPSFELLHYTLSLFDSYFVCRYN